MRTDLGVVQIIDETLKSIWENEIQNDYNQICFMNEDTLKNVLYFHLRSKLEKILIENDLRILTEFTDAEFNRSGFRPDMVIAKINMDSDAEYWRKAVEACPIVIELKFKSMFADKEAIYADYSKLEKYIKALGVGGKVFMVTIWECQDAKTAWLDEETVWAKGKLTELNASLSWDEGEPQFYVVEH